MDREEIGINTRNYVDSARDRDYWRALVNVALNLWVQGAVFFFLLLSLSSPVLWRHEEGNFFLPIQLNFRLMILFKSVLSSSICSRTSLVTFSEHFIFSILLQHHISKLSKYFCSNFLDPQVSEPYKAMLQILCLINFFLNSMFSLFVNSDIFLLNASLIMPIVILKTVNYAMWLPG